MRNKKMVGVALAVGLVFAVSACGAGEQQSTASAGGAKPLQIGIVTFSATDVATSDVVKGAEDEAKALGWTTTLVDANGSVDAANSAIQNLVQKKSDAILVTIFPSTALATGLAAAAEAKVPVVTLGGGEGSGISYESDDVLAEPLSEKLVKDVAGIGNVLALNYRGGRPCQLREAGFDKITNGQAGLNIVKQETPVPGQMEASRAATLAWLTKTKVVPGKTAVWTCFDDQALGVVAGLKEQNLAPGDVWVYSVNGTVDALNAVKDGWMKTDLWIDHYGAGKQMVDVLKDITAAGSSWEFKSVPAPFVAVSAENYDQFKSEHPQIAGLK